MANKIGRNKKSCEKYKNSGHRAINKQLKQERHKKRMERFAKRKEEGKDYATNHSHNDTLEKINAEYDTKSAYFKENSEILLQRLFKPNRGSDQAKHTEVSRWKSLMRKVDNELSTKKAEEKVRSGNKKKKDVKDATVEVALSA